MKHLLLQTTRKIAILPLLLLVTSFAFSQNCARVDSASIVSTGPNQYRLTIHWSAEGQKWLGVTIYCGTSTLLTDCISTHGSNQAANPKIYNFTCSGTDTHVTITRNTGPCGHGTECTPATVVTYTPPPPPIVNLKSSFPSLSKSKVVESGG